MARRPAHTYPFTAIVGQEMLKTALVLNAIDPRVGGVLVRGEKGTAKSTAVRALASLLPEITVVEGCAYACDPSEPSTLCAECVQRLESSRLPRVSIRPRVVDLPVSATEDRLVGTLDFEAALQDGKRAFHPGLLADANRSILYVDEVNLLDDHLVDTLLDAAAMGVNVVEREGVSVTHPSRFILVGTMNPEEGEIRPQLLDRFGLCVEVSALRNADERVEVMRRRRSFEEDPGLFAREWEDAENQLRDRIEDARGRITSVHTGEEVLYAIADLSIRAGVDGHRADTVMARAAAAYASLEGRTQTTLGDVEHVAPLVLAHRLRRTPLDRVGADAATLRSALVAALGESDTVSVVGASDERAGGPGDGQATIFETTASPSEEPEPGGRAQTLETRLDSTRRTMGGKRQESTATSGRGRYRRAEKASSKAAGSDIALDATIRAAAMSNAQPLSDSANAISIAHDDIMTKVRTRKVGATIVFCVDASGSMGASSRIRAAKSAILDLLADAYQRRDRVALITFQGDSARLVLAPTASVELASLKLRDLPTGGATPIAAGIDLAIDTLQSEHRRQPESVGWVVLITDGQANVGRAGGQGSADAIREAGRLKGSGFHSLVIDTTQSPGGGNAARELAQAAGGEYVRVVAVDGGAIQSAVRERI